MSNDIFAVRRYCANGRCIVLTPKYYNTQWYTHDIRAHQIHQDSPLWRYNALATQCTDRCRSETVSVYTLYRTVKYMHTVLFPRIKTHHCRLLHPPPRDAEALWRVCLCVCLCVYVCLSARISPEPHERSLPIFLCMLSVAVARSSSDDNVIRYVLPGLRMTPCLPIIGYMARGAYTQLFTKEQHRGRSVMSTTALL